jgi:hypothetical protein
MKLTSEQEAQLGNESAIGTRAVAAYNGYIKEFVAEQNKAIFDAFTSSQNLNDLPKLKEYQLAIASLEQAVLTDIETGKLAIMQLNNNE